MSLVSIKSEFVENIVILIMVFTTILSMRRISKPIVDRFKADFISSKVFL